MQKDSNQFNDSTKSFVKDRRGVVLALYAIGFAVLILSAALAINFMGIMANGVSRFGPMQERANMQMAADAAARSAAMVALRTAYSSPNEQGTFTSNEAKAVAAANNYGEQNGYTIFVNIGANITEGNFRNFPNAVEVIITKPYNFLFLTSYLGAQPITLRVRAVSAWLAAPAVIALNPTSKNPTGITVSGGAQISIPGGLYSNDPASGSSISINGSDTQLCSNYFGMVGGTDPSALCSTMSGGVPLVQTGMEPLDDPFSALDFSVPNGATPITLADFPTAKKWNDVLSMQPGVYDSKIDFSSGTHTFPAGTYYFNKSLNVTGGKIDASAGVTFVFAPGSGGFSVSGNAAEITIVSPTEGSGAPYPGIAIASKDTSNQGFNSANTTVNISGVLYAPYALINYNATKSASNSTYCLNIYAWAISMAGGASMGKACPPDQLNTSAFQPGSLVE